MNTETVQPLSVTATKPASSPPSESKRSTESPVAVQALTSKAAAVRGADTRTVQQATAAAATQIESYLRSVGRSVQFSIDSASGRTVISVRDVSSGDVIRQIPSEEALRLAQALGEQSSTLLDVTV